MLKRKIAIQILFVVVVLFTIGPNAPGALINMTSAEQQVGGEISYTIEPTSYTAAIDFDPVHPKDVGDADLDVSLDSIGVIISDSLTTVFSEDQVTAEGSAFASAVWGSQPTGADDVHGGGGSTFKLYFTKESAPANFQVNGQIDIDLENYPDLHPDEVFAYVKLSSHDGGGMTIIWEESANGEGGDISLPFAHSNWLESGKIYLLEAYAEAGTVAVPENSGFKSRTASYSFTTTTESLDIDWIGITSCKQFRDGEPQGPDPWSLDIWVRVVDPGTLHHIDVTKPGDTNPFVTMYEEAAPGWWGCSLDDDYETLDDLRDVYQEGTYILDFRNSESGLVKSLNIAYNGLPDEPDAPVNFTYPLTDGQTGISVNPTFTWDVSPTAANASMTVLENDEVVYFDAPVSISSTSWTPGSLLYGYEYELDVSVMNIKDWAGGPEFPTMTDSTGDTFSYSFMVEYLNEIVFTTLIVDIVPDTISTRTKTITCNIWPPYGYDVTEIDTGNIWLKGSISPVQISVRRKQQMLVVKFPTSGLSLVPDTTLDLTVTGEIIDGPSFEGTDSVVVVQKGKPK